MIKKFAFFDGDNIGEIIEKCLHKNMIREAQIISQSLKDFFENLCQEFEKLEGIEVILSGGDDLLISFDANLYNKEFFEIIRRDFYNKTKTTICCGIGCTIQESIFSLYLAKLYGKNQLIESKK